MLDQEKNYKLMDNYIEVEYDMSNVMFVTMAKKLKIPAPLMDRMEIIRIAGYTEDEKLEIAKRHLLSKAMRDHALQEKEFSITDEALLETIRAYTREAGVRNYERELNKIARKAVTEILRNKVLKVEVTKDNLHQYLGVPRFRHDEAEREDMVGVVNGLAWKGDSGGPQLHNGVQVGVCSVGDGSSYQVYGSVANSRAWIRGVTTI